MIHDRVTVVEANLDRVLDECREPRRRLAADERLDPRSTLTAGQALALFEDQLRSRVLDVVARELKATGDAFYTISSAGHEDNAVLGARLRPTDPGFLHYRSGGLMMARARQVPDSDPIRDTLLSLCASAEEPVSGGRHKVWGSIEGWVVPQTSTIASQLPKAVGAAFTLGRADRLGGPPLPVPSDSIAVCSFGDASANHASALAAINAARYSQRQGNPMPVLLVCEDNGIGISVETPSRWIEDTYAHMPGLTYVRADGDLGQVWDAVGGAIDCCRSARTPVFLHLPTVRLWGHAGSDAEHAYRSLAQIEAAEARDPLVRVARQLLETGAATGEELQELVDRTRRHTRELGRVIASMPKLESAEAVLAPLAPYDEAATRADAASPVDQVERARRFGGSFPEDATAPTRRTMAAHINATLHDELGRRPNTSLFGEDVGRKGGVYNVTTGLQKSIGRGRVFDTLLDETTILGVAQGAALLGQLPIPEIQYLAYIHNALDQLRGEACSMAFFSAGQYRNPMVIRIAGLAYQKGFGGHFHNDNSIGALRDIPGLVIAVPSRGDDAARMLRGCLALAQANGRVVAFIEPIALYHERDLHQPGDGAWLSDYPPLEEICLPGEIAVHNEAATDVLIVSYANGLRLSLRAAWRLREEGIRCRVLDLRWLSPLPLGAVEQHAAACDAVVVVDECRSTGGGIADAVVSHLTESGLWQPTRTVRAADTYIPLGPAADHVLVSEDDILTTVHSIAPSGGGDGSRRHQTDQERTHEFHQRTRARPR